MFTRTESFKEFIRYYPVVTFIIFIHIVLYIMTAVPFFPNNWILEKLAGVNLYIMNGEIWRLVTPIFLHSGFSHMLFNSISLILFGPGVERILGKGRFLTFYLATGILANIATLIFNSLTYTHVGSSGAIFGLFGLYMCIAVSRKDIMSKQNSQVILTITIISLIMTFIQPNVNVIAHLFGLLSGFAIGIFTIGSKEKVLQSFKAVRAQNWGFPKTHKRNVSLKYLLWGGIILLTIIGLMSR